MTVTETRYTSVEVTELAGCTYRMLDHWCRCGVFGPRHEERPGSGRRRSFTAEEVTIARVCGPHAGHRHGGVPVTSPAALASIARMEAKYGVPSEGAPTPDTEPTGRKPKVPPCPKCGDPICLVCTAKDCGLRWCQHHACDVCGFPVEHRAQHPDGRTTDEEWEGRARMAAAKQAAGGMLNDVERRALALFPDPARLTIDGYRRSDGTRPEWAGP